MIRVTFSLRTFIYTKVDPQEAAKKEMARLEVDASDLQRSASSGELEVAPERRSEFYTNQEGEKQAMPARIVPSGEFVRLVIPEVLRVPVGNHLNPLNLGQKCLIDALLNLDDFYRDLLWPSGNRKDLGRFAAVSHDTFQRDYNGLTISRPVVAMGEQLDFLPGSLEEKMRPWLQPIYDVLEFLIVPKISQEPRRKRTNKTEEQENKKPYDDLVAQGVIAVEALAHLKGRSIPKFFFILDEVQQLTPR